MMGHQHPQQTLTKMTNANDNNNNNKDNKKTQHQLDASRLQYLTQHHQAAANDYKLIGGFNTKTTNTKQHQSCCPIKQVLACGGGHDYNSDSYTSYDVTGTTNNNQQQQQHSTYENRASNCPHTTYFSLIGRKLFTFFYFYAILIISIYLTYAACYHYYQHHQQQQQQQQRQRPVQDFLASSESLNGKLRQQQQQLVGSSNSAGGELELKFETKIRLLERYIDSLALDLQETKVRLRERERCDCSISCSFNGTRYEDKSSWQSQCDVCTCRAGTISCLPQKCPILTNCDSPVQLPGQCCPTCMKKCKYNNTLISHGQKFNPNPNTPPGFGNNRSLTLKNSTTTANNVIQKECKCYDGLIKCLPIQTQKDTKRITHNNNNNVRPPANQKSDLVRNVVISSKVENEARTRVNSQGHKRPTTISSLVNT